VWSHGLDLTTRDNILREMYESTSKEEACQFFKEYNVDYIFISDLERTSDLFDLSEDFFIKNFNIIYDENNSILFEINCKDFYTI
jgi:uncharacterized membrane protein